MRRRVKWTLDQIVDDRRRDGRSLAARRSESPLGRVESERVPKVRRWEVAAASAASAERQILLEDDGHTRLSSGQLVGR